MKPGCEIGSTGLAIHRATLREAADLFALTLAIQYESFFDYSRGFVLEALGDFEAAARVSDGVTGSHAQYGGAQAARCRSKAAGTWEADAENERAFAAISAQLKGKGSGSRLVGVALKLLASVLGRSGRGGSVPVRPAPPVRAVDPAALDRAANVAQVFAEHLVAGDFDAAQALLARPLQHLSAADLRDAYTSMTDDGDEGDADGGGAVSVVVMTCDGEMTDLGPADLGWVYVAISGELFNEAVTVVVTDEEGEGRIRDLESGRP